MDFKQEDTLCKQEKSREQRAAQEGAAGSGKVDPRGPLSRPWLPGHRVLTAPLPAWASGLVRVARLPPLWSWSGPERLCVSVREALALNLIARPCCLLCILRQAGGRWSQCPCLSPPPKPPAPSQAFYIAVSPPLPSAWSLLFQ